MQVGRWSSVAVDSAGNPAIAYSQDTSSDVRYAKCDNPTCQTLNRSYDLPEIGLYNLQSVATGRYLDADADGSIGTSRTPQLDDQWGVFPGSGSAIDNVVFDTPATSGRWDFEPEGDGTFYLEKQGDIAPRYLSSSGGDAFRDFRPSADRWVFVPVEVPNLIGERVSFQNVATQRWLDTDPDATVGQSVQRGDDDIWLVEDAGDGAVFLRSEVTGRYLDGDRSGDVGTSAVPRDDDRWFIEDRNGFITFTNAAIGGLATGLGPADAFDAVIGPDAGSSSLWRPQIITS